MGERNINRKGKLIIAMTVLNTSNINLNKAIVEEKIPMIEKINVIDNTKTLCLNNPLNTPLYCKIKDKSSLNFSDFQ